MGDQGSDPAERFRLRNGTHFGIIASTTAPFCRACDRSRVTAIQIPSQGSQGLVAFSGSVRIM